MEKKYFRNEIKLVLTHEEYLILSSRVDACLDRDPNMKGDSYYISSLYFDDVHSSALREKIAGEPDRKKFRIRVYDLSDKRISLECKEKRASKIHKSAVLIDRAVYDRIIRSDYSPLAGMGSPVSDEMLALSKTKGLRPSVIVNYERSAYIHPLSTTRITFDRCLCVPINTLDLFDNHENLYVFPQNHTILEIKYNEYIPKFVTQLLSCYSIPSSASKFVLCRECLSSRNIILKV